MRKFIVLASLVVVLALSFSSMTSNAQSVPTQVAFYESFNDGEIFNNPSWDCIYSLDQLAIVNNEMHANGSIIDTSSRYQTQCNSHTPISTTGYLEFSYRGLLKSSGSPQNGIIANVVLVGPPGMGGYDLHIARDAYSGFPINHNAIAFSVRYSGTIQTLIASSFTPQRDQFYHVRAVRENGVWTLFVDNVVIGSVQDPLNINEFRFIHMPLWGSVVVDDIQVIVQPDFIIANVDIQPGDNTGCINNNGHGVIPVAILGSASFDTSQIDANTVQLEGLAVRAVGKKGNLQAHSEDVNSDGFMDLVVQIEDEDGVFTEGQGQATLTGQLYDGTPVNGTDSICVVP